MIVYVESNFVVEFALEQEELVHVEAILSAAEGGKCDLVMPAFSIAEPISTVLRRPKQRAQTLRPIDEIGRQLSRSATHVALVDELRAVVTKLGELDARERDCLQNALRRLFKVAPIIPTTRAVFDEAETLATTLDLSLPDSIVLASVLADLRARDPGPPKLFLTRNPMDFDVPDIVNLIKPFACEVVGTFKEGASKI